jgi:hypothetical protein
MDRTISKPQITKIGFHYYPDTVHFRETDLNTWLPELKSLGASWLTLTAPLNRLIPEAFIRKLIEHRIQPILHFNYSLSHIPTLDDFMLLCRMYFRWGGRYIVLFDRPNLRANWPGVTWAQTNLVERFLDIYQPLAITAVNSGLIPVFPPLEPGGDYWDTAFLRTAFEGLARRNQKHLLERMAISGYARTNGHPLSWGSGGPERWPAAHPYDTPDGCEDQRGFRIFDWYLALSEAVFGRRLPMILFGCHPDEAGNGNQVPAGEHTSLNLLITRLLMGEQLDYDPIPTEVLACNFWLLAAEQDHPGISAAWFKPDGSHLPIVDALRQWAEAHQWFPISSGRSDPVHLKSPLPNRPISHYLLLPSYDWGSADWHLEMIRPYVKKHHPTIGFSPAEAVHAQRVTILGDPNKVPNSVLDALTTAGCQVIDLRGDGTTIATKLAALT